MRCGFSIVKRYKKTWEEQKSNNISMFFFQCLSLLTTRWHWHGSLFLSGAGYDSQFNQFCL